MSASGPFCSIDEAAAGDSVGFGDEAVIKPGNYSDTAGDLGAGGTVTIAAGNVHGEFGQPRPFITLNNNAASGAFAINGLQTLAYVAITTAAADTTFKITGSGVVDRVIARNTRGNARACTHERGLIKNSACLASGELSVGVGATLTADSTTGRLLNMTARGNLAGSSVSPGISYNSLGAGTDIVVTAQSVIAQGNGYDVSASTGAPDGTATINLDYSNYDAEQEVGSGAEMVTNPGTLNNQTGAPMLASDGFHQLAGSPTIDAGTVHPTDSGTLDIDVQSREIPAMEADIGADELGHPTGTSLMCFPPSITLGASSNCVVTVTDISSPSPTTPTGGVALSSNSPGSFSSGCGALALVSSTQANCTGDYTPSTAGTHQVTGSYIGDATHEASTGSSLIPVAGAPPAAAGENPECAALRAKLASLNRRIKNADDPVRRAKLKKKRRNVRRRLAELGCPA